MALHLKTTFILIRKKLIWIFVAVTTLTFAQQDPMYNQYIFNAYTINAAEAGTRNYGTASMLYRWQWVGIDGSPATGSVGVETGFGKGWGMGLNMVDDRIGPAQNQTINLSMAYHIALTDQVKMSLGVNVVSNVQRVLLSRLQNLTDLNDPKLAANINNFNPNAGGGLLIYSAKSFFGAAMPRFSEYKLTSNDLISLDQLRHYFIYGGHTFDLGPHIKLRPSVLAKVVEGAPLEMDFNGVISLYEVIDIGANYRSGDGLGLLLGLTIMERLILNYAYEIPLTRIRFGSIQTHEVGVRYRFGRANFERIQSPRFFN
jgi:type IX secretion system PorP/SprF family membrane protein